MQFNSFGPISCS